MITAFQDANNNDTKTSGAGLSSFGPLLFGLAGGFALHIYCLLVLSRYIYRDSPALNIIFKIFIAFNWLLDAPYHCVDFFVKLFIALHPKNLFAAPGLVQQTIDALDLAQEVERINHENGFICPISRDLMHTPVLTKTGNTFERENIKRWFAQNPIDPLTGVSLSRSNEQQLVPNRAKERQIAHYLQGLANGIQPGTISTRPLLPLHSIRLDADSLMRATIMEIIGGANQNNEPDVENQRPLLRG